MDMVRPATLNDAKAIPRVNVATWRSAYRGLLPDDFLAALDEANYAERWTRLIGEGSSRVFVAEEPVGVVGFAAGVRGESSASRRAGASARESTALRASSTRSTSSTPPSGAGTDASWSARWPARCAR